MSRKNFDIIEFVLLAGIIIFLNIIFTHYFIRIDLTEDKRYTLSQTTRDAVSDLQDILFIEVFLDGELTPDYERLKRSINEKLKELKLHGRENIEYKFTNPNAIEDKRLREQYFAQLLQKGIQYKYERIDEGGKVEEKIIFPSALLNYKGKEVPVMFLKGSKILSIEEQLNQSVEGVEYELISAIRKLNNKAEKTLAFVEGHGELDKEYVADISTTLSEYYNVERISLSETIDLAGYKSLIIAGPTRNFSDKEKYLLDQYVVNGGSLLVGADALNLNEDSLMNGYTYAFPYETGLDDLLFKFGVRVNKDLVLDLNSALIKVETGNAGQTEMVNWPYHPIVYNYGNHLIVKNMDAIVLKYAGTIDTVKAEGITKTPLLFTTATTRTITAPARLDLNETRNSTDTDIYKEGQKCVGYLLEGKFQSNYKLRNSPFPGRKTIDQNKSAKIIVLSDSDIIKNNFDFSKNKPVPLGYDPNIRYEFSNKQFLLNAIDYLMDENIVNIRSKEIKLRPLDKVKVNQDKFMWQVVNLVLPALLIIIFGIVRNAGRVRKYTKSEK